MSVVELWPGLLPLAEARWAKRSRLLAEDGILRIEDGRKTREFELEGCHLHPLEPIRDERSDYGIVAVNAEGTALCALDLAEWVPVQFVATGKAVTGESQAMMRAVRNDLAAALRSKLSSTPWTEDAGEVVSPVSDRRRLEHRTLLLTLAVVMAVGLLIGTTSGPDWLTIAAGLAAIPLAALGLSPDRQGVGLGPASLWVVSSHRFGNELRGLDDGRLLHLVDVEGARAGFLPTGRGPERTNRVDVHPHGLRMFLNEGVPAVELLRETWGEYAFAEAVDRLESTPGVSVKPRDPDRPWPPHVAFAKSGSPLSLRESDFWMTGLLVTGALLASSASVVAAVLFGVSAMVALALGVEQVIAGRSAPR